VYDPGEGIKKLAIQPGTPFSALDVATFRCPVCRSPVKAFKDIGPRNKPSGFEENLGYGLGVNQLTPGQKNVLIFGGFALAIAFFLSLYSLR
jgi:rubredoxin